MGRLFPMRFSTASRFADWCMHALSLVVGRYAAYLGLRQRIPDKAKVSRMIFDPQMGADVAKLVWEAVFQFPSDREYCESVVWRRFAPADSCVHSIGCKRQRDLRSERRNKTYKGTITAHVWKIREFRNPNNHGFHVIHAPSEGIHHAHIRYDISPDKKLTKIDKNELRFALKKIFSVSSPHNCD